MKNFKKMMALVIAMVMIVGTMNLAVFAAGTNNLTLDNAISVSGLEEGDTVVFYKVLEYSQDATTTGGWKAAAEFTGLTTPQIQKMLGIDPSTGKPATSIDSTYGITSTIAGTIGDMAEAATPKYNASSDPAVVTSGSGAAGVTAKVTGPEAGLYVAIVKPGIAENIYNPVFVGADFKQGSPESSNWAISLADTYSDTAVAKKAEVTVEKTASTTEDNYEDKKPETVAVGDTITFTITTTIPEFADNYTFPAFAVSDVLSDGLKLNKDSIKVYTGTYDKTEKTIDGSLLESTNYVDPVAGRDEIAATATTPKFAAVPAATDTSFTVSFNTEYIKGLNTKQPIVIQYTAEVLPGAATESVSVEDNTVTVNFSNEPTDTEGHGILKDETKHYTFDIDGNLLGKTDYHASELVKVGLDKNGNEITESRELANGSWIGALQNAEFKLYVEGTGADSTTFKDYQDNTKTGVPYSNGKTITADTKIVSDADGRLTIEGASTPGIRGLDAGTYYLVETKAPDGYIKSQTAAKIVIEATIADATRTETNGDQTITWTYPELKSYTVTIDGQTTASYTITNSSDLSKTKSNEGDTGITTGGSDGKIKNTQGVELPSTGGMGTTLFYIIGAVLVLGAGILLVTRRRMSAN